MSFLVLYGCAHVCYSFDDQASREYGLVSYNVNTINTRPRETESMAYQSVLMYKYMNVHVNNTLPLNGLIY